MQLSARSSATSGLLIGLLIVISGRHVAHGYGSGAPPETCVDMLPVHGVPAQTRPHAYTVNVSSLQVFPSDAITVTIAGDKFRGFMVRAYSNRFPVGSMEIIDSNTKLVCTDKAVTHSNGVDKASASFKWRAPSDLVEGSLVIFVITMVKEKNFFWTGIQRPLQPLIVVRQELPTPPITNAPTPPITNAPTVNTTTSNNNNINTITVGTTTTTSGPAATLPTPASPVVTTTLQTKVTEDVPVNIPQPKSRSTKTSTNANPVIHWISAGVASFLFASVHFFL